MQYHSIVILIFTIYSIILLHFFVSLNEFAHKCLSQILIMSLFILFIFLCFIFPLFFHQVLLYIHLSSYLIIILIYCNWQAILIYILIPQELFNSIRYFHYLSLNFLFIFICYLYLETDALILFMQYLTQFIFYSI